jgi:ribA/ribD-fused uncharacterized protein
MYTKDDCVCFWTTNHVNGWASQWYPAPFTATLTIEETEEELHFPSAEHWMMTQKALLFGNVSIARTVLGITGTSQSDMKRVKGLGRKVKGFDDKVWAQKRSQIVLEGSLHKFRQNEELRQKLLETGDKMMVEASPRDKIWGIGMSESKAFLSGSGHKWGLNLLGKALVETRKVLRDEESK